MDSSIDDFQSPHSFSIQSGFVPETPSPPVRRKKRPLESPTIARHDHSKFPCLKSSASLRQKFSLNNGTGSQSAHSSKTSSGEKRHEELARLQKQRQRRKGRVHQGSDSEDESAHRVSNLSSKSVPYNPSDSDSDGHPYPIVVETPQPQSRPSDFRSAREVLAQDLASDSDEDSFLPSPPLLSTNNISASSSAQGKKVNGTFSSCNGVLYSPKKESNHSTSRLNPVYEINHKSSSSKSSSHSPSKSGSSRHSSHHQSKSPHSRHKSHSHKHSSSHSTHSRHSTKLSSHSKSCSASHHSKSKSSSFLSSYKRTHGSTSSGKHLSNSHVQKRPNVPSTATLPSATQSCPVVDLLESDNSDMELTFMDEAGSSERLERESSSDDMEEAEWEAFMRTLQSSGSSGRNRRVLSPEPDGTDTTSGQLPGQSSSSSVAMGSSSLLDIPQPSTQENASVTSMPATSCSPLPSLSQRIREKKSPRSRGHLNSRHERNKRRTSSGDAVNKVNQIDEDAAMARRLQEEMDRQYAATLAMEQDGENAEAEEHTIPPDVAAALANITSPLVGLESLDVRNNSRRPTRATRGRSSRSSRSRGNLHEEFFQQPMGYPMGENEMFPGMSVMVRMGQSSDDVDNWHPAGFMHSMLIANALNSPRGRRGRGRRGRHVQSPANDGNDYEELLALQEMIGNVNTKPGLTKHQINLLPTKTFKASQQDDSKAAPECHICMSEVQIGDSLRILTCFHEFHVKCIDRWIKDNPTCPVCREEVKL